jgi:hypothetical protein
MCFSCPCALTQRFCCLQARMGIGEPHLLSVRHRGPSPGPFVASALSCGAFTGSPVPRVHSFCSPWCSFEAHFPCSRSAAFSRARLPSCSHFPARARCGGHLASRASAADRADLQLFVFLRVIVGVSRQSDGSEATRAFVRSIWRNHGLPRNWALRHGDSLRHREDPVFTGALHSRFALAKWQSRSLGGFANGISADLLSGTILAVGTWQKVPARKKLQR